MRRADDPKPPYKDEGIAFTEDFKREAEMIFTAGTYQPFVDSLVTCLFPQLLEAPNQTIEMSDARMSMRLMMQTVDPWVHSRACTFSGIPIGSISWRRNWQHCGRKYQQWSTDRPITIPVLNTPHGLYEGVWMSLSPMEVATLRKHHTCCKGRVLIGGLGLGYSTLRVLQREKTVKVTIVEKFKPLIDLIGPQLKVKFGNRVELIHGDVWEHLKVDTTPKISNYDTMFIDIWQGFGGNKYDHRFGKLKSAADAVGKKAYAWG